MYGCALNVHMLKFAAMSYKDQNYHTRKPRPRDSPLSNPPPGFLKICGSRHLCPKPHPIRTLKGNRPHTQTATLERGGEVGREGLSQRKHAYVQKHGRRKRSSVRFRRFISDDPWGHTTDCDGRGVPCRVTKHKCSTQVTRRPMGSHH